MTHGRHVIDGAPPPPPPLALLAVPITIFQSRSHPYAHQAVQLSQSNILALVAPTALTFFALDDIKYNAVMAEPLTPMTSLTTITLEPPASNDRRVVFGGTNTDNLSDVRVMRIKHLDIDVNVSHPPPHLFLSGCWSPSVDSLGHCLFGVVSSESAWIIDAPVAQRALMQSEKKPSFSDYIVCDLSAELVDYYTRAMQGDDEDESKHAPAEVPVAATAVMTDTFMVSPQLQSSPATSAPLPVSSFLPPSSSPTAQSNAIAAIMQAAANASDSTVPAQPMHHAAMAAVRALASQSPAESLPKSRRRHPGHSDDKVLSALRMRALTSVTALTFSHSVDGVMFVAIGTKAGIVTVWSMTVPVHRGRPDCCAEFAVVDDTMSDVDVSDVYITQLSFVAHSSSEPLTLAVGDSRGEVSVWQRSRPPYFHRMHSLPRMGRAATSVTCLTWDSQLMVRDSAWQSLWSITRASDCLSDDSEDVNSCPCYRHHYLAVSSGTTVSVHTFHQASFALIASQPVPRSRQARHVTSLSLTHAVNRHGSESLTVLVSHADDSVQRWQLLNSGKLHELTDTPSSVTGRYGLALSHDSSVVFTAISHVVEATLMKRREPSYLTSVKVAAIASIAIPPLVMEPKHKSTPRRKRRRRADDDDSGDDSDFAPPTTARIKLSKAREARNIAAIRAWMDARIQQAFIQYRENNNNENRVGSSAINETVTFMAMANTVININNDTSTSTANDSDTEAANGAAPARPPPAELLSSVAPAVRSSLESLDVFTPYGRCRLHVAHLALSLALFLNSAATVLAPLTDIERQSVLALRDAVSHQLLVPHITSNLLSITAHSQPTLTQCLMADAVLCAEDLQTPLTLRCAVTVYQCIDEVALGQVAARLTRSLDSKQRAHTHPPPPMPAREQCLYCSVPVSLSSLKFGTCANGHCVPRSATSLCLVRGLPTHRCPLCDAVSDASERVPSVTDSNQRPTCFFCGVAMANID